MSRATKIVLLFILAAFLACIAVLLIALLGVTAYHSFVQTAQPTLNALNTQYAPK